jgi:hypothetical protein
MGRQTRPQINSNGTFHCFFLDDDDFAGTPADVISKLTQLSLTPSSNAQFGAGPGQYLSEEG